jgi:hypothetical protein
VISHVRSWAHCVHVVFEWAVTDTIRRSVSVSSEACVGIEDNGRREVASIERFVPVWLATSVVALGFEEVFVRVHEKPMVGEKSALVLAFREIENKR